MRRFIEDLNTRQQNALFSFWTWIHCLRIFPFIRQIERSLRNAIKVGETRKRKVRLISKAHYPANTAPLFSQLKVIDIYSFNSFSVATFMYSYHHNPLLSGFRNLFLSSNQVHHYETRLASQYRPHLCRTSIKHFSIRYRGPTIWNSLPITNSSTSRLVFTKIWKIISLIVVLLLKFYVFCTLCNHVSLCNLA